MEAWVQRAPGATEIAGEQPVLRPRPITDFGTIYYNGTQSGHPTRSS